jgi:hypothetical protein
MSDVGGEDPQRVEYPSIQRSRSSVDRVVDAAETLPSLAPPAVGAARSGTHR